MAVIRFNEECEISVDVNVKKDLSVQDVQEINDFFRVFKENIYDYDTNEEFIDAGMKELAKEMKFQYEIVSGPDFQIDI